MEGKDESTKLWWPFNSIRVLVGTNNVVNREMVVAQLVEQSLLIPEVRGSNPVIGKIYNEHLFTVNCIEKTKRKKKRPGMAHLKNTLGPRWLTWVT